MNRIEKTVFISYRRTNAAWALAIFNHLTQHGYDAFVDFQGIASGDFERVILENIRARAHFLVLLTPSALERCSDRWDWLRPEIETALDARRNMVPLMLEGFDFTTPSIANHLTGQLTTLKQYNALRAPADYFAEAAEAYYNRGDARYDKCDLDGALKDYAEAIRLKTDYATAYNNRGNARRAKGDLDGALKGLRRSDPPQAR